MTNNDYPEINLCDIIRTLIKRWKIIITVLLIVLLVTCAYSALNQSYVYQTEAKLKIGQVSNVLLETKEETKQMLLNESQMKAVLEKLSIQNPSKETINSYLNNIALDGEEQDTKPEQAEQKRYIRIVVTNSSAVLALKITQELTDSVLARHQTLFTEKIITNKQITEKQLEKLKQDLTFAESELEKSERLVVKFQNAALQYPTAFSEGSGTMLAPQIPTHNALFNQVQSLKQQIWNLKNQETFDEMTTIISSPMLPTRPIESQNLLSKIIIGFILGTALGILSVFSVGWWEKNSLKLKVQN